MTYPGGAGISMPRVNFGDPSPTVNSLRIAFVSDRVAPAYTGGYEVRLFELAKRLAQRGHAVDMYTSCDASTEIEGVRFLKVCGKAEYFSRSGFRDIRQGIMFTAALTRCFGRGKSYDVIDANATPWVHLPVCATLARRFGAGYVVTAHEALSSELLPYFRAKRAFFPQLQAAAARAIYGWTQRSADVLVTPTSTCVDGLRSEGFRQPVFVVEPGCDRVPRHRIDFHRQGELRLLFLGRHVQNKRLHVVFEAMVHVTGARLTIGGDGPLSESYRAFAANKLSRTTRFLGSLSESEKNREYLSADAVVIPSYREGHQLVAMEAMCHGAFPIFARRPPYVTGVDAYATDLRNALTFDGSAAQLRALLSKIASDRTLVNRLRLRAWLDSERFGWSKVLAAAEEAYATAANLGRRPRT